MKLVQTIMLLLISAFANGQDIAYTLAHTGSRKWIGIEKTQTLNGASSTNLIFYTNHKVEQQPVNSYKSAVSQQWQLISGSTVRDENITLQIGPDSYSVVFSKTSNGSDFMILTTYKNDRAITSSYYSE